jgi:hypothetical protein
MGSTSGAPQSKPLIDVITFVGCFFFSGQERRAQAQSWEQKTFSGDQEKSDSPSSPLSHRGTRNDTLCRICETHVDEENLQSHTQKCLLLSQLDVFSSRWEGVNDELRENQERVKGVLQSVTRAEQKKRFLCCSLFPFSLSQSPSLSSPPLCLMLPPGETPS